MKSVLRSGRCSSAKGTILAYSGSSGTAERGVAEATGVAGEGQILEGLIGHAE